ncbi:hypothetical protein KIN20_023421 [Parelaphostrongylus tenuis]|uniref:G-protein coupled receptors family 1 profile domain-containing protein n=1 Tax=Parelaphostrongylus tenuis TaxID=148309 RepID=A0AAD5QVU9_PARTN|nr:hypothetical protein KIN20_023421 [Parelaphostrongylus tenuis]
MSEISFTPFHVENIAVSVIIAVIGTFGLVSNCIAILALRYNPALRNSFGLLCLSHSIAGMIVLLAFVFWAAPTTLLESALSTELIGKVVGAVIVMFWNVYIYTHLAISLNRVIVITFPLRVTNLLTVKNTSLIALICCIMGFFHATPLFWTKSCYAFFDTMKWDVHVF